MKNVYILSRPSYRTHKPCQRCISTIIHLIWESYWRTRHTWTQPHNWWTWLLQGRHVLLHFSWISEGTLQDIASHSTSAFGRGSDLKDTVEWCFFMFLTSKFWEKYLTRLPLTGSFKTLSKIISTNDIRILHTLIYTLHLSKRIFHFIAVRSSSVKLTNSSGCNKRGQSCQPWLHIRATAQIQHKPTYYILYFPSHCIPESSLRQCRSGSRTAGFLCGLSHPPEDQTLWSQSEAGLPQGRLCWSSSESPHSPGTCTWNWAGRRPAPICKSGKRKGANVVMFQWDEMCSQKMWDLLRNGEFNNHVSKCIHYLNLPPASDDFGDRGV